MSNICSFEIPPSATARGATRGLDTCRPAIAHDVVHALGRGELHLAYQPIYRLATGRMAKVEALLRWRRQGVSIPPDEFIPWMEETGAIAAVGEWVVASVCRQAAAWNEDRTPVRVSFNVSPRQLEGGDFCAMVRETLARTRCNPEWLEVEVTEQGVMRDSAGILRTLAELSDLGIAIAIDDFGAGYSSLTRLADLPARSLKLDRALVAGACWEVRRAAVVDSIVTLGRTLDLDVTAEGIEDAHDAAYLSRFEGILVQGFLFSRPVPADRIPGSAA